jgi:hypothetical protein
VKDEVDVKNGMLLFSILGEEKRERKSDINICFPDWCSIVNE